MTELLVRISLSLSLVGACGIVCYNFRHVYHFGMNGYLYYTVQVICLIAVLLLKQCWLLLVLELYGVLHLQTLDLL